MIYLILIRFGVLVSALATTIVLYIGEHDTHAAVTAMITMPLVITSSALISYNGMPVWLRSIAMFNPMSLSIDAVRSIGTGSLSPDAHRASCRTECARPRSMLASVPQGDHVNVGVRIVGVFVIQLVCLMLEAGCTDSSVSTTPLASDQNRVISTPIPATVRADRSC